MGNNNKSSVDKAMELVNKIKKMKKIWIGITASLPVLKALFAIVIVVVITILPIMFFNYIKDGFFDGADKLMNFMSTGRWMSSENQYFHTLEKEYNKFNSYIYKDGEFDIPLLAATSHYANMFGPNDFDFANEDDNDHKDYDADNLEHAVKEDTSRSFYKFAEKELGTSTTIVPTSKKLIGHLVDIKIETHCAKLESFSDAWSIGEIYWSQWKDFAKLTWYTAGDTTKQIIGNGNIIEFVRLIHAYKKQGYNYVQSQLSQLVNVVEKDNVFLEIIRILDQSNLSGCDEANEVPVPIIYRFINYENYKRYLKNFYLKNFYINCKHCALKDKPDDVKEKAMEQMIDEIFSQKEMWDHLTEGKSGMYIYIPGMSTIPVQPSGSSSWREGVSRGWQLGTAKCFVNGVWNGKTNCSHLGIDFTGPIGTPIYAIAAGKVETATYSGGYGLFVLLEHDVDGDGKRDYFSAYAHMSEILVSSGQTVTAGQMIGKMGSTGNSSGSHLHFEIRDKTGVRINPEPILDAIESGGDNPLEGKIACNIYSHDNLTQLNDELSSKIASAGLGTREAVVAAARYLTAESGVKIPYWFGGKSGIKGYNPEWGCGKAITDRVGTALQPPGSVHPYGLDCSGFVSWSIYNAGYKSSTIKHSSAGQKGFTNELYALNSTNLAKAKPGDLVWNEGHIGILLSVNPSKCEYSVAEAQGAKTGVLVTNNSCYIKRFSHIVLMDSYYNNTNNKG